jgi:hypothetical protein
VEQRSGSVEVDSAKTPDVQEILAIFRKWGIRTLGDLAVLDKEELRARLGSDAVRLWERAIALRRLSILQIKIRRGRPCFDAELRINSLQMFTHRRRLYAQNLADLTVGFTVRHPK